MVAVALRVMSGYGKSREGKLCLPMTPLKWRKPFPEATPDFPGSASNWLELGNMSTVASITGKGETRCHYLLERSIMGEMDVCPQCPVGWDS